MATKKPLKKSNNKKIHKDDIGANLRSCTIHFSDTHWHDTCSYQPFNIIEENGFSKHQNNIINGCQFVANKILEYKPLAVFFHGDMFEMEDVITNRNMNAAVAGIRLIMDACHEVKASLIALIGNHDYENEKFNFHWLNPFRGMFDKVIDNPETIKISNEHITKEFGVLPYSSNKEVIKDILNGRSQVFNNADIVLTHLDFKGSVYESGKSSNSVYDPVTRVKVISGDIHLAQIVGNVHYIGSLVQYKFNRNDMKHVGGIIIYDMENDKVYHEKNDMSVHFVKITDESDLEGLDLNKCILNVRLPTIEDSMLEKIKGAKFIHVPIAEKIDSDESKDISSDQAMIGSPEFKIRSYIERNKPEALVMYDRIMGELNDSKDKKEDTGDTES